MTGHRSLPSQILILTFQNKEKERRATELCIANSELVFQNQEKEKKSAGIDSP